MKIFRKSESARRHLEGAISFLSQINIYAKQSADFSELLLMRGLLEVRYVK